MDDGILSPAAMLGASDSAMDLDYMDELLLAGCWLEATDGSEFLNQTPPYSSTPLDPSLSGWSALDVNGDLSTVPPPNSDQNLGNEKGKLSALTANKKNTDDFDDELRRRWWIAPGPASSVRERLMKAVEYIKDFVRDKDVLIQVWVPVNTEGRTVLTTTGLPYSVNTSCSRLSSYGDISMKYQFSAEKDSKDMVGLPSRVFIRKVPEWTPDVTFFRSDEYPRVSFAQQCDVRGTLALPVFEQGNKSCLGVIEVVMTSRQIKYGEELESVCKALEAVDLRSYDASGSPNVKVFYRSNQDLLLEIQGISRFACESHSLPLAQTWASCAQQGREGCRHSDENYILCVSTVDQACFVADPSVKPFQEACSEHHLLKGQGVVGEAFTTNKPCFMSDIRSYGNTEYPLSHHARMFDLQAAVAIRLRSIHARKADFVLEFFLPTSCTDSEEQKKILLSLSIIIQHSCRNLRVVTDKEFKEEGYHPFNAGVASDNKTRIHEIPSVQINDNACSIFSQDNEIKTVDEKSSGHRQNKQDSSFKEAVEGNEECINFGEGSSSTFGIGKTGEKRRTKAEKAITLQVLRQYFAGSLKDAAKSLGVCPTTLKRICRQHGIKRWPSRKIKKVGHSLEKLKRVIDSVEGGSGAFQLGSLYSNFPELASPNVSRTSAFLASKMNDCPKTSPVQLEGSIVNLQAPASKSPTSSCSQGSSSSLCCSSKSLQFPIPWNEGGSEDPNAGENVGNGELKRVKSEAELHVSSRGGLDIPRSTSFRGLGEHRGVENFQREAKDIRITSEEDDFLRLKVTYGDEKIRLRMHKNQGYRELLNEIGSRFQIIDTSKLDLKYLDDDSEWVLLTCDADLEECMDVYRQSSSRSSTRGRTIKLSLQLARVRNSLGSHDLSQL